MAHVRTSGALKPDGMEGGRERSDGGGKTEKPSSNSSTGKKRSMRRLQRTVCLSVRAAVRRCTRGSQWTKWCVKSSNKRCRGSDFVQDGTDAYRGWIMSQHLASTWASYTLRSISQMDYLPNGPWQGSFLWVVSYASLRQKWTLLLSLCLLPNTFHFHLHSLLFVSVATLNHPSPLLRGWSDGKRNSYWNREDMQIGYISFPLSLLHFFQEGQVISCR